HGWTKFQIDKEAFSSINAWWMAELSRLIYRLGPNEALSFPAGPARQEILNSVGLGGVKFIRSGKAECSVGKSSATSSPQSRALVFRGSDEPINWLSALGANLDRWVGAGHVHEGFRDAFETLWPEIEQALNEDDSPVYYTGHSLGAALA